MKRALFDTVTVLPFASGNVVDRTGYESAVLAVTVEASQTATIKVETADSTAGPYEPVKDGRIFVDNPVNEDGEAVIENEAEAQAVANLDIDLIGCKGDRQCHYYGQCGCRYQLYCTVQQDIHGGRYAGVQNAQQQQLGSHQGRQRCWAGCKLLVCWCHEVRDHQWQGGCDYDLQLES